ADRQHEAVTSHPVRCGRVVTHDLLEEEIGGRRQTHRGSGVSVTRLFYCVHRQRTDRIDGTTVEVRPVQCLRGVGVHGLSLSFSGTRSPGCRAGCGLCALSSSPGGPPRRRWACRGNVESPSAPGHGEVESPFTAAAPYNGHRARGRHGGLGQLGAYLLCPPGCCSTPPLTRG